MSIAILYADENVPTCIMPIPKDFNESTSKITSLLGPGVQWFEEMIPAHFQMETGLNVILLDDEEARLNPNAKVNRRASAMCNCPGRLWGNFIVCQIKDEQSEDYLGFPEDVLKDILAKIDAKAGISV